MMKQIGAYSCEVCPAVYDWANALREHMKAIHRGRRYNCTECDKEFGYQHHLKTHIRSVHEGVRKHKCDYCSRAFRLESSQIWEFQKYDLFH